MNKIEDGEKVLSRLAGTGVQLAAAFWAAVPGDEEADAPAELFLAVPGVRTQGSVPAYGAVRPAVAEVTQLRQPPGTGIEIDDVRIVDADDPMVRDVVDRSTRYPGYAGRWHRSDMIGRRWVTGLYIYPAAQPAPSPGGS